MKTDSTPTTPFPKEDNPLFNLPWNVNNFFLKCGKVATEGGEIDPLFGGGKTARAKKAAQPKPSANGKEATDVNGAV